MTSPDTEALLVAARERQTVEGVTLYDRTLIRELATTIADLRKQVGVKHDEANRYVNEMIDAKARVSALSAEVERLKAGLAEMLFEYGDKYDSECRLKSANELEIIKRARATLNGGSDHE